MKHKFVYLLLLLCLTLSAWAENASNIRIQQTGRDIVITYDLKKTSNVRLLMSIDGGDYHEVKAVDGAVGNHVSKGQGLQITYHPLQNQERFIAKNVRFKVEAMSPYEAYANRDRPIQTYILGQYAYGFTPQRSCGFVFGQNYYSVGWGWFIDMRSNWNFNHFSPPKDASTMASGGIYSWYENEEGKDPVYPFYTGKTESTLFTMHAGFSWVFRLSANRFNTLGFYFGLGGGVRRMVMETTDGQWVEYSPTSYKGFSGNIGLIGSIYGLTLRAGVNTIAFKYGEIEAAIGWMF